MRPTIEERINRHSEEPTTRNIQERHVTLANVLANSSGCGVDCPKFDQAIHDVENTQPFASPTLAKLSMRTLSETGMQGPIFGPGTGSLI
jgi:hypothetical protein